MRRNVWITAFVVLWIAVFHYETLRLNYLSPVVLRPRSGFRRELPKLTFLYPPAGWIMFFNVDRAYGFAEVYGVEAGRSTLLDPHDIFETRAVLYDNIHRNVLISVLSPYDGPRFCRYLSRKFPQYGGFTVVYAEHSDLIERPNEIQRGVAYRCP